MQAPSSAVVVIGVRRMLSRTGQHPRENQRGACRHPDRDDGLQTFREVLHQPPRCYTFSSVPTTRPRLTITETDDLAAALDAAAARWPDVRSRRELLLRLVEQGREVIGRATGEEIARRREAIRRTSG